MTQQFSENTTALTMQADETTIPVVYLSNGKEFQVRPALLSPIELASLKEMQKDKDIRKGNYVISFFSHNMTELRFSKLKDTDLKAIQVFFSKLPEEEKEKRELRYNIT